MMEIFNYTKTTNLAMDTTQSEIDGMERIRFKPMNFSVSEIDEAINFGRMLTLMTETTGRGNCGLKCIYCFKKETEGVSDDAKDRQKRTRLPQLESQFESRTSDAELSLDERLQLIRDAHTLGARSVQMVGALEPLWDPKFKTMVSEARRLDMEVMVPTNGIALQNSVIMKWLEDIGVSVLLKFNSRQDDIENQITGTPGYAKKRNRVLDKILERGILNRRELGSDDHNSTRFGLSFMITLPNIGEALETLAFCRRNNIAPFMDVFIPLGKAMECSGIIPSLERVDELFRQARKQDRAMGFNDGDGTIYLGGQNCNQRGLGPHVDIKGEIHLCVGETTSYGNVREVSLDTAWTRMRSENLEYLKTGRLNCPPRDAAKAKFHCKTS